LKQKELANWLKIIIVFCWLFGLLFCVYVGPETGKNILLDSDSLKESYKPLIAFIWITGIPYFFALCIGWSIYSDINVDYDF